MNNSRQRAMNALFITPYMLLFMVWIIGPAIAGFIISLCHINIFTGETRFAGADNYLRILRDDLVWRSLANTTQYTILSVIAGNAVSLLLAYALARGTWGKAFFQVAFFTPVVLSIGVTGVIWGWLYNADFGLLNYWLQAIGLPSIKWLTNPHMAMLSIVAMAIWAGAGFNMMIYLAGMLNVPRVLYEAAEMDGAGAWHQWWYITMPMMRYTFAFTLTVSTIGAFQIFDQPYILTGGGPDYSTYTYVYHIYSNGFRYFRLGYAGALSYLLACVIIVAAFVQYRLMTRTQVEQ